MNLEGWRTRPLGDFLNLITYGFTNPMPTTDAGPFMLTAKDIRGGKIDYDSARHTSPEAFHSNLTDKSRPNIGDILLTKDGSIGRVAVCDRRDVCINQSVALLRPNADILPTFLSYLLQAPVYQRRMESDSDGSTIKHIYITRVDKMPISVPDMDGQAAIVEVLGALDDKIAANTKLIAVVGEALNATFTSICGHPERMIPFGELATITKGVSYRSADLSDSSTALVTLKSFDRNGGYSLRGLKGYSGPFKPAQQIMPGELAVAQTDLTQAADVVGRAVRVPAAPNYERLVASLDLAIVRPSQGSPVEFLLGVMLQGRFRAHCKSRTTGTTVLHLASDAIPSFQAPLVSQDIQDNYASVARPMLQLRDSLEYEVNSLASTRDALLPQLMSGKLRVKDAEKVLENAGV